MAPTQITPNRRKVPQELGRRGKASTKVCIILSKPELRERRRERGNARGGGTELLKITDLFERSKIKIN